MLTIGEKCPAMVASCYDGSTLDLGKPGRRTALWFSPKSGRIDEFSDRFFPAWSP